MYFVLVVEDGLGFEMGLQELCIYCENWVHIEAAALRTFPVFRFSFGSDAIVEGRTASDAPPLLIFLIIIADTIEFEILGGRKEFL